MKFRAARGYRVGYKNKVTGGLAGEICSRSVQTGLIYYRVRFRERRPLASGIGMSNRINLKWRRCEESRQAGSLSVNRHAEASGF